VVVNEVEAAIKRAERQSRRPLQLRLLRGNGAVARNRFPVVVVAVVADQRVDDALSVDHANVGAIRDVHGLVGGDRQT